MGRRTEKLTFPPATGVRATIAHLAGAQFLGFDQRFTDAAARRLEAQRRAAKAEVQALNTTQEEVADNSEALANR